MKYLTAGVVFSEIPDEITLEIGITNCPYKCKGCHSPFLQGNVGKELSKSELDRLLNTNSGITCVLFSGGDLDYHDIEEVCKYVRNYYPNIKTAWYSGREVIPQDINPDLFDYIKVGPYIASLGGLDSPLTNQRLYKMDPLEDITYKFWK